MTLELLAKAEKLRQEQSRARERVIALNKKSDTEDGVTDEERGEMNGLVDRLEAIEPEIRGATTAEAAERANLEEEARQQAPGDGLDSETRERNEVAKKARVGSYLLAAISGRRVDGAEAELRAAFNLGDDSIPMAAFDVPHAERLAAESRAVTPAPGTVGINMGMVQPFVFASSIAARLGIEIRDVPSGTYALGTVTTAPSSAAPKAKGTAADETAGALTVASASPKRIPARLSLALEDVAAIGTDSFEDALRQALQSKLSDSLDDQIINGNGGAVQLSGLLSQLDDATAPAAAVETFERWAAIAASVIDGLWATMLDEVATIWNAEAYRQASGVFRGADGPVSAAAYLARECAGFTANARMPDTVAGVAQGIAARLGQPGLTRAVVPSWGRIVVDDVYSNAAEGQRHFTVSAIVGNLMLVQADAYEKLAARASVA